MARGEFLFRVLTALFERIPDPVAYRRRVSRFPPVRNQQLFMDLLYDLESGGCRENKIVAYHVIKLLKSERVPADA